MPIFWQNQETVSDNFPEQSFVVGNEHDDVFAFIWSRTWDAFRDTVRIRSEWMWGKNATHTYNALLRLTKIKVKPQVFVHGLRQCDLNEPNNWVGIRHEHTMGSENHHLLTPVQNSPEELILGISNKRNTRIHTVSLLRSHFWDVVFSVLLELRDALRADNAEHVHWYDRLRNGDD